MHYRQNLLRSTAHWPCLRIAARAIFGPLGNFKRECLFILFILLLCLSPPGFPLQTQVPSLKNSYPDSPDPPFPTLRLNNTHLNVESAPLPLWQPDLSLPRSNHRGCPLDNTYDLTQRS